MAAILSQPQCVKILFYEHDEKQQVHISIPVVNITAPDDLAKAMTSAAMILTLYMLNFSGGT